MSVGIPRDKVVFFRLTKDELNTLRSACAEKGARSLSEYTRSELLFGATRPRSDGFQIGERLCEIEKLLGDIQATLNDMARLLECPLLSRPK